MTDVLTLVLSMYSSEPLFFLCWNKLPLLNVPTQSTLLQDTCISLPADDPSTITSNDVCIFDNCMCVGVLLTRVCASGLVCLWSPEEGMGSLRTGIKVGGYHVGAGK